MAGVDDVVVICGGGGGGGAWCLRFEEGVGVLLELHELPGQVE